MPIQDFGAVCDISTLTDKNSLEKAHRYFKNSGLYLPSPTYSWLSRSKLIEVRNQPVKYSLIRKEVQKRKIYPIHFPEIYDELSRQILFDTDHNIPLTDIRSLLLSTHLQIPTLTFDPEMLERISKEIGMITMKEIKVNSHWKKLKEILRLYREMLFKAGAEFHKNIEKNQTFPQITQEIEESQKEEIKRTLNAINGIQENQKAGKKIKFHFLTWDILPSLREYHTQKILPSQMIERICERTTLLIATPENFEKTKNIGK